MNCFFCTDQDAENKIDQSEYWNIYLSNNQTYLGRCLIALKRHASDLAELEKVEWQDFINLVERIEKSMTRSFEPTLFNWACLMNNAYQEIIPNPHVHWHLVPRYSHVVEFDGEIFEDLEFGHHYNSQKSKNIPPNLRQILISRIKKNL